MAGTIDTAALTRDIIRTQNKLDALERKVRTKILRKAARAAAAPVVKELKRQATVGPRRELRRTMGQTVKTEAGGVVVARAGQSITKRRNRRAVHLHLVDQDTAPHVIANAAFTNQAGELIRGDLNHPGTTGDEFVESTQRKTLPLQLQEFANKAKEEIKKEVPTL